MRVNTVVRIVMIVTVLLAIGGGAASAQEKAAKSNLPNILVIMGDDIGYWNLSTYNQGMMGFRTPICPATRN